MRLLICLYYTNSLISYFHISLDHFSFICFWFYFTFFLYFAHYETCYKSKWLIRFNYNPHSIIIAIFETESFHFTLFQTGSFHLLNKKVSKLKCISLTDFTSALNTLFWLERNFYHWEKGWNESRRQCIKSVQKRTQKVFLLCRYLCLW